MNKHTVIVIIASFVIAGPFVYAALNISAAQQVQFVGSEEKRFSYFDMINDGEINVCNPNPFYVVFDKMDIIMIFEQRDKGLLSIQGTTLPPLSITTLEGKYLGLIGCGNIGKRLGRLAKGLNMNIIGYDVIPIDPEFSKEVGLMKADLDTLLQSSDYVSIHVPLLDSTYHLIDSKKLSIMKKTAKIINTSRGGVIDEDALYDSLKNENLGGAALDVFEKEPATGNKLATLPNVILTPHIGAQTKEAQSLAANVIAEKIIQILRGVI